MRKEQKQKKQKKADFRIEYDGTWLHEGVRIQREALAKLFSDRALKIDENGDYWLQTPFEKYPVDVVDVPFVIVDFAEQDGDMTFATNMHETVVLGPAHPLELREGIPYIEVRDGLFARISRAVYYNLIEAYGADITSRGITFKLGEAEV